MPGGPCERWTVTTMDDIQEWVCTSWASLPQSTWELVDIPTALEYLAGGFVVSGGLYLTVWGAKVILSMLRTS